MKRQKNPYRFSFDYTIKQWQKRVWLNRKMEFHAQIMAACFFLGLFLIIGIGNYTIIKWITVSRIWIGISLVFILIPNRYYPLIFRIHRELKVLFALFAMGSLMSGLFLLINFLVVIDSKEQKFEIKKAVYIYSEQALEVEFEIDQMIPHRDVRRIQCKNTNMKPDCVIYQVNRGIFGVKTLRKGRMVYKEP